MKSYEDEQRARLTQQWEDSTDPEFRAAYALARRAGFHWYDTESSARRMAEHAGAELLDLAEALRVALPQLEATPRANVTAHAAADIVRAALIKNGWSP